MIKNALVGLLSLAAATAAIPINLVVPAYAVDNIEPSDSPDLTSVRSKIDAKDYAGALAELRGLAETFQQADVYNLLGFTLRKTGDFETALTYYDKALQLEPDHKGAHEYLGELYVETGKIDKAQEQLASLTRLCPAGCDELQDLRNFIASR
ncbi:MAG: tetratricopeptide repeat protein [Phyllobacterium sp.]|uniref:tetratricopeptide repeat protein n=1 Tax=Phyllobacterium sp. TaxID=1871046 RepID=UPI0030F1558B